jgi:hypothetical protein
MISGTGLASAMISGFSAISFRHSGFSTPAADRPRKDVGAGNDVGQLALVGLLGINRFPAVHQLLAALIDEAFDVVDPDVLAFRAERDEQIEAGERGRTRARGDDLCLLDRLSGQFQTVQDRGGDDDRGAVLVVVEDGDVHLLAQLGLDLEALRRLDVFQVDAAEGRLQRGDDRNHRIDGRRVDLDVEDVDAGELLEQDGLAFHHRLGGERADIAEAEDGGAVGDDGDEIAPRCVERGGLRDLRQWRGRARRRPANRPAQGRAGCRAAWLPGSPVFRHADTGERRGRPPQDLASVSSPDPALRLPVACRVLRSRVTAPVLS